MGEIAALLTSVCWAFSGIFFSAAGKKIGAFPINRIRLSFAIVFFFITHLLIYKSIIPLDASPIQWIWFALSGIVGLIIGDTFLYQAFVYLGVRIPTLIMASVPVISALFAWLFLHENLAYSALLGIFITIIGIAIVVFERNSGDINFAQTNKRKFILGILCALGGATGQAGGLVLAKFGLQGGYPVISGTVIRMLAAVLLIWIIALFQKQAGQTIRDAITIPQATRNVFFGSIVGPYIGVWLSLTAVQSAYIGTSSTLMALSPIILLPIAKWGYKENISRLAVIGTLVTIAGVTIIFMG
jgi:drug/metabolite transporter (DMT)-like permease